MKWKRLFGIVLCFVTAMVLSLPVYAATESVELSIEVENIVEGDTPPSAEDFTFILEAVDGAPMPESRTITISGAGTGYFLPITYTEPEPYHYILREVIGSTKGYTYDDRIYDVTVQVTTDEMGMLHASMYVCEQGSEWKTETVKFVNQYKDVAVKDPEESKEPENVKTPETGDNTNPVLWSVLGSASFLILIGEFVFFRKNQNKKVG